MVETIDESGARVRLWPRDFQSRFERARTMRDIVLKPRQIGMTTWELARDIWYFLTHKGAQVVVVVQSMSDDGALRAVCAKARLMFDSLTPFGVAADVNQVSVAHWEYPAHDASLRIVGAGASEAAASKKGRAGTIHRLHVTELAFFEYANDTLNAMLECVPAREYGSEITIESTPNGASGLFFELYHGAKDGKTGYQHHFYPWIGVEKYRVAVADDEHITPQSPRERELVEKHRVSAEQLKWYRAKVAEKGQDLADQEYPVDEQTCWLTSGRLYFDRDRTQALLTVSKAPFEVRNVGREAGKATLSVWSAAQPGRSYVISVDPSEGVGGDNTAAVVLDRGTGQHVATLHGQLKTWETARLVVEMARSYGGALIAVERNNHGHAVINALQREHKYQAIFADIDGRLGWNNTGPKRTSALEALFEAHRAGHWTSPDEKTLEEMLRFVVTDSGKAEAAKGSHDDLVLAHVIGWDVICRPVAAARYVPRGFVA